MFCLPFSSHCKDLTVSAISPKKWPEERQTTRINNPCCHEIIIYFVCQNNTHAPTPTLQPKTSFAPPVHCIWCILENALFQNHCCHDLWVLKILGNQELNKSSQSTVCVCVPSWRLLLISVSLLCLSQRWIVPMVCLQYKVQPSHSSSPALSTQGLVWPSRQPAQPSLVSAELPWFQRYMNATQMKFSGDSVAVSAGLLQWMQSWLYGSLNRDTKVIFGMLVQCYFDFKSHWFLTWITQAWE